MPLGYLFGIRKWKWLCYLTQKQREWEVSSYLCQAEMENGRHSVFIKKYKRHRLRISTELFYLKVLGFFNFIL